MHKVTESRDFSLRGGILPTQHLQLHLQWSQRHALVSTSSTTFSMEPTTSSTTSSTADDILEFNILNYIVNFNIYNSLNALFFFQEINFNFNNYIFSGDILNYNATPSTTSCLWTSTASSIPRTASSLNSSSFSSTVPVKS